MHLRLLILFFFFCNSFYVYSQSSIKNQGARLHIAEGAFLHCPGNIEIADQDNTTASLELSGELILKGNFLNYSFNKRQSELENRPGCLRISAEGKTQLLRGLHELYFQHIILDNPQGLRLEKDVHILGTLRLQAGKIYTGEQHLILHNPTPGALLGANENRYIIGNLRRYLGNGQTQFPIGSKDHLQLLSIDFPQEPALLFLDASFDPRPAYLSEEIEVDNGRINTLLDNGTWTLYSPQMPMQAFQLSLTSRGHSNGNQVPASHSLLIDKGFGWEVVGNLERTTSQGVGDGPIKSTRSNIMNWGKFSIGQANYALSRELDLPFEKISVSNNGSPQREISLSFISNKASDYQIEVRDLKGSLLIEIQSFASVGENRETIQLKDLPQAVYVLSIKREDRLYQEKIW